MDRRAHGPGPYEIVAVHGGPGAPGSAWGIAAGLSGKTGRSVLEPFQTRSSLTEAVEELAGQIQAYAAPPVTLIGHSWGAWLSALVAARNLRLVRRIILVSSGPLEASYAARILSRRKAALPPGDAARLEALLAASGSPGALRQIGALCEKADGYRPRPDAAPPVAADAGAHRAIWAEAAVLRESGALLDAMAAVRCPIVVVHGAQDPHPAAGMFAPLLRRGIPFEGYLLARYGHTPWLEAYARDAFFDVLARNL